MLTCTLLATKVVSRKVLLATASRMPPPHARFGPRATLLMKTVFSESLSVPWAKIAPPASHGLGISSQREVLTSLTSSPSMMRPGKQPTACEAGGAVGRAGLDADELF
jgi:hypothetical protein